MSFQLFTNTIAQEIWVGQPKQEEMDRGCGIAKTICSICYEDLKPIVEDLQSISICGHVFHELCLQQWFEYCSSAKKYSCPVCKQTCTTKDVGRLYFQSVGDATDLILTQKPINWVEKDPEALQIEVRRLEVKVSGLNSALERQGKDLRELNEELYLCRDQVKKEVGLRNEALKEKASVCQLLHIKSEELDKSTMECKRLQERSMALAKELAAFKLVSELDLDEEEVLKLASLGSGANNKETIDILRKSLVMRNRSYKELMNKCNLLGRGEARSCKKLEKAKEKINKLKARLQEIEKAVEAKDNEVLRVLKDSKKPSIQRDDNSVCCKCNMISDKNKPAASPDDSGPTASLINDRLSSKKRKKFQFAGNVYANRMTLVDTAKDICSSMDKNASEFRQVELGHLNPNLEYQISEEETDPRSYHVQLKTCNTSRKSAEERTTNPVNNVSSAATVNITGKTSAVAGDESKLFVIEDTTQYEPVLNIKKESSSQLPLNRSGGLCFSGGLLGPDGSKRYLGRWCKRGQINGSGDGELIVVGADGRGGKVKVLRTQNKSSLSDMTFAEAKRCKYGVKNVNLQIEHFFGRVSR